MKNLWRLIFDIYFGNIKEAVGTVTVKKYWKQANGKENCKRKYHFGLQWIIISVVCVYGGMFLVEQRNKK